MSASRVLLKKHFLSTADLTRDEIRVLIEAARGFSSEMENPYSTKRIPLLEGKTLVHLFFEASTRTWASFDLACRNLAAQTLNFNVSTSSVQKGETLLDTAKNIQAMKCDGFIVRHQSSGAPLVLSRHVNVPVINAGDGFHEHPTQALLDLFTMESKIGSVQGKNVVIVGDIAHSRVARSNIHVLKKMGAKVAVCGPPTLLPPEPETLGVKASTTLEAVLPDADVVMMLRVQMERQNRMQIPSLGEYSKIWGLTAHRAKLLRPSTIILHPGPINRGVEIAPEVADGPHSVILDQVMNGISVRMAVLAAVYGEAPLIEWLNQKKIPIPNLR